MDFSYQQGKKERGNSKHCDIYETISQWHIFNNLLVFKQ